VTFIFGLRSGGTAELRRRVDGDYGGRGFCHIDHDPDQHLERWLADFGSTLVDPSLRPAAAEYCIRNAQDTSDDIFADATASERRARVVGEAVHGAQWMSISRR
jgi:hypothetical protein